MFVCVSYVLGSDVSQSYVSQVAYRDDDEAVQCRRQDLVPGPGRAHAKITVFLQESAVDI